MMLKDFRFHPLRKQILSFSLSSNRLLSGCRFSLASVEWQLFQPFPFGEAGQFAKDAIYCPFHPVPTCMPTFLHLSSLAKRKQKQLLHMIAFSLTSIFSSFLIFFLMKATPCILDHIFQVYWRNPKRDKTIRSLTKKGLTRIRC